MPRSTPCNPRWKPLALAPSPTSLSTFFGAGSEASSRSEEHTSELQSLIRISYAVFCLKKKIEHICTPVTQTPLKHRHLLSIHIHNLHKFNNLHFSTTMI